MASTTLAGFAAMASIAAPVSAQQDGEPEALEEITVTGSYIRRRSQTDTASPIQVVGRDELQAAGVTTISDFTQQLTINNGAQNNPDAFTQNLTTGTSNINLRGLGVASTLVLLNGKRTVTAAPQTDGGVSFVDTASLVPPIAIDQVEVLKDGAGPLYGSDAVAGVVNFKTRSDFEGFEIQSEIKNITETSQRDITVGAIAGWKNETFRFMGAVNYFDRSNLSQRDRDLRTAEAIANNISISTQSGFPGTFIVPTAPQGNLTDTIAFLSAYDQLAPVFANPASPLAPDVLPTGLPAPGLPPELAALGITSNSSPGFIPFPGVAGSPVPGSVFTGYAPANAAAGGGVINIPAAAAALLGLNDGSAPIALGADGVADALTPLVYNSIYGIAAPGVAAGLGVPPDALSFATPGAAAGAATPAFADPFCREVAQQFEDVVPLIQDFTNPLDGSTAQLGACGYDFNNQFDLVPEQTRLQGYAEFGAQLGDSVEFYSSFSYAENESTRGNSNFPITSLVPIAGNNPFNTFRTDVFWVGRSAGNNFTTDPLNPNPSTHDTTTWRLEGGFKGEFGNGWIFDVSGVRGESDWDLTAGDGVRDRFFLALQGFGGPDCDVAAGTPGQNGCQFFNPFGNGLIAGEDERVPVLDANFQPVTDENGNTVLAPVRNSAELIDWMQGQVTIDGKSEATILDGVVSGDLFETAAGPIGAAFGFQYRDQSLSWDYDGNTNSNNFLFVQGADDFDASQDVFAFFGEVLVPITSKLELSAAVRYENYSGGVGDTIDPKFAVRYNPTDEWSFRATYSSSFRAPSIFQQFGNQTTLNSVRDPRDNGQPFIAIRTQGADNLSPETADTYTVGFTWQPQALAGFTFDVNFWRFEFNDVIVQQNAQELVNRALLGGETDLLAFTGDQVPEGQPFVFLDPADGSIDAVQNFYENAAFINTDGLDVSASYVWETDGIGTFNLSAMVTYVSEYDLSGPGGITIEAAGRRNRENFGDPVPELRGQAMLGWNYERHTTNIAVRHIGQFTDDQNSVFGTLPDGTPDFNNLIERREIDGMTTVDLFYSYDFSDSFGLTNAALNIGALNVFNVRPPAVLGDGGFETRTHDPRQRIVYAGIRLGF